MKIHGGDIVDRDEKQRAFKGLEERWEMLVESGIDESIGNQSNQLDSWTKPRAAVERGFRRRAPLFSRIFEAMRLAKAQALVVILLSF